MNRILWVVQALLAAVFLFAGGMKLVLPLEVMTKQMPLPGWFLRFTGTAEVLGARGLIRPGVLRIRQELTPMAAAGLTALVPATVGLLAVFVVDGRAGTHRADAPAPDSVGG